MYRKDRKREGGGIIPYFDSSLPSKELKVMKKYKTPEILAAEARLGNNDVIILGIYRPPKQSDHQPRPTLIRTYRGGTEWHLHVGIPQETGIYSYR